MPQLEYGDYYKFRVSVGIALVVVAVFVPWLFLRESFDLLLDSNQLLHLTSTAQIILGERQHLLASIFRIVPWVSGSTFLIGISLAVNGLYQWRKRQAVRDQSEELGLEKLKRELIAMSPQQVTAKLEADVEQERESTAPPAELVSSAKHNREIELLLQQRMSDCFNNSNKLRANQRLGSAELDVVLESRNSEQPDVIVEIKYIRRGFQFGWMRESVSRLVLATDLYTERLKRKAVPLLLIITAETVKLSESDFARMRQGLPQLIYCRVERLEESKISAISCADLRRLIFG
jgi:hypothetical protein